MRDVSKVFALENNKDFSQLRSAAESTAGEKKSIFGNNMVFTSLKKEFGNQEFENQPPKALSRSKEFYVAPAAGGMGYISAAQRFLRILAMVWAGSQVTKILRAGGALAIAPFVDKGLSWFTTKFRFKSRGSAFGAIVLICVGLALVLFITVTLLWA